LINDITNGTNTSALEIKSAGNGMISLTTRGQLGIESQQKQQQKNKNKNKTNKIGAATKKTV